MPYASPRYLNAGDEAVVVELGNDISLVTNRRVHELATAAERSPLEGIVGIVPSYRSVLVQYDAMRTTHHEVREAIESLLDRLGKQSGEHTEQARVIHVPVLYGGSHGLDIQFVGQHCGLSIDEVISLHSEPLYPVYMMGFSPGFPYLGGLSEKLVTPRMQTPRVEIPGGSVGIAEAQTGVYPVASPGGWRLIGRTPLSFFDHTRTPPSLIDAGDFVRFTPLQDEAAYEEIAEQVKNSGFDPITEPVG
jgi:inhibitor of KinA